MIIWALMVKKQISEWLQRWCYQNGCIFKLTLITLENEFPGCSQKSYFNISEIIHTIAIPYPEQWNIICFRLNCLSLHYVMVVGSYFFLYNTSRRSRYRYTLYRLPMPMPKNLSCDWSVWIGLRGCNWENCKLDPIWDMRSESCALIGQYD